MPKIPDLSAAAVKNRAGLGIELDEHLVDNERGIPEWQFPEMWDSVDGSVRDH
jgi:galactonate dehydratase